MTQGIFPSDLPSVPLVDALLALVTPTAGVTDLAQIPVAALIQQLAGALAVAALGGQPYPTVAAGLAAVADGAYFAVPSAGAVTVYRKVDGAAEAVATTPSEARLAAAEGDIDSLTAGLATENAARTTLAGQVAAAEDDIGALTADLATESDARTTLAGRVTAAEGGIGALTADLATESAARKRIIIETDGDTIRIRNAAGSVILTTTGDGLFDGVQFRQLAALVSMLRSASHGGVRIMSPAGHVTVQIGDDGAFRSRVTDDLTARVAALEASPTVDDLSDFGAASKIILVINWGQSKSGGTGGNVGTENPSLTPLTWALRFGGGVRTIDGNDKTTTEPLVETSYDTGMHAMCRMIRQTLLAECGYDLATGAARYLCVADGQPNQSVADLLAGYMPRVYASIDGGATAAGYAAVQLGGLVVAHGERDTQLGTAPTAYAAQARHMLDLIIADATATYGAARRVPILWPQTASASYYGAATPEIDVCILALADQFDDVWCPHPGYIFPASDGPHLTAAGYRHAAAFYGYWLAWLLYLGRAPTALRPSRSEPVIVTGAGRSLILPMEVNVAPIVLDTALVTDPGAFGFSVVDPGGAPIAVAGVEVVGPRHLALHLATAAPSGRVRGGWNGTTSVFGAAGGNRICLRDSNSLAFDDGGVLRPMHDYCRIFNISYGDA